MLASFLVQHAQAAPAPARLMQQTHGLLAHMAPAVLRLFSSLAGDGHALLPCFEHGLNPQLPANLPDLLARWASACGHAAKACVDPDSSCGGPASAAQQAAQQAEEAAEAAEEACQYQAEDGALLASALVQLLAMLPRLAHRLNGGSGEPGSCGCDVTMPDIVLAAHRARLARLTTAVCKLAHFLLSLSQPELRMLALDDLPAAAGSPEARQPVLGFRPA
ncbi:hypothetical protein ABPG75_009396 [Micractinium tetrahymenae]